MSVVNYVKESMMVKNTDTETAELLTEVKVFFDRLCAFAKPLMAVWSDDNDKVTELVKDEYTLQIKRIDLTVDKETIKINDVLEIKALVDLARKIPKCEELSYFGDYSYNRLNDDAFDDAGSHFSERLNKLSFRARRNVSLNSMVRDDGSINGEMTLTSFHRNYGLRSGNRLFDEGVAFVSRIEKWEADNFLVAINHPADIDTETAGEIERRIMEIAAYDLYNSLSSEAYDGVVEYVWAQNISLTRADLPVFIAKLRTLAELIKPVLGKFCISGIFASVDPENSQFSALRIETDDYFNVRVMSAVL